MTYLPNDVARCAGAHKPECEDCLRNIKVSPLHPDAFRSVWIGPWVLDTPCISKLPKETTNGPKHTPQ
jgi:hypothetical protein